ncbi:outer membrane beta-barrel protein [Helicobacter bizzozeronii]|uniref:outer membrane beta-barrel protein n=1 Tax=Helicobacter bizzozeronii TaxID=56877 RepID=UPI000CEE2917|nr:outer membrane beta-barrel protein [Helicobacter bizzozeronii]
MLNTSALGGATQALSSTTLGSLNIYDWSTLNPWLKQVQDMAGTYYSDRASFSGVSSAGNVLGTGPISGSTWWEVTASKGNGTNIGTGAEAAVAGAFSASSTTLGTPPKGTTASDYASNANKLMSTIYNNIIGLADNTNLLGANTNGNDYGQDLSALLSNSGSGNTIYSAGLSLADAASTAAAAKTDITTPGLAQSVQTINSIMFTAPSATDSIIPTGSAPASGQGTNYSDGSPGALDALQGLGALNSLIAGGIATSATELNANATTVATAVEAYNTNANALLNNITNIADPTATTPSGLSSADANVDAVINALEGVKLGVDATYAINKAAVDAALSGLNGIVNPGAYQVVWDAYQGLVSSLGSDQAKALGITTTTNVQSAIFNKLQQASQAMGEIAAGATTIGGGANAALSSSTFGGSGGALSGAALKAVFNLFNPSITSGSGSSATTISPYQEFQNTIAGLKNLVSNTTQTSTSATAQAQGGTADPTSTTLYPAQIGDSASGTSASDTVTKSATATATNPIDQSIAASGLANQVKQEQATNVALAKLIGLAASYAGNVNTLNGMLSTTGQAGLGAALGAAANNAAANALLNGGAAEVTDKADAANNAAKIYNTITEIKNADTLLNQYVNALTANVVGDSTTNQGNYAYALGEFNKLLNAPQSGANDTGLITSTLDSINKLLAGYNATPAAATGASKTFWTAVQAGDAKAAIQTLQESVSSGLNYLANQQSLVQGAVNGTVNIDSQVAGSLLGSGGLGVSNAQMANAVVAVNSLSDALTQLSSDLNGGAASTTVISTLMGTGSNNLTSIVGLLSALNTATAAATASFGDQGGIANTSNIATGNSNTGGVGSDKVGGNFAENTNAPNYINNLAALSTITNAIGDIANANGATSNFTNAFVTNTPVSTIASEWAKITADLKTNDSTNQALAIAALETNDTTALGNLLTSGAGGVGTATTAWQTITQTDNLLSTFNSALTADNQVSNLTLSGKDATAASSVLKLLNLATDLQGAVNTLTTADTGLATANVASNALNVDATTASSFVNAQNAASAYSALQNALAAINKGGATLDADGLLGVIRQINIYQQNTAVLNGLKGANATKSVAQIEQVLANMLTGTAPNTVAGTATQAGLQAIQNLINRYNYLEGLSTQVNTALSNNPIALLDAFSNSKDNTNFKDALESLGTAGFSANVANNYGTLQASGNYAATTGLTQQALTSLSNAISNNSDAIQAWGALVGGTSGSTTTALQTAASAATNLASLYGSVSTGSLNSLDNNLSNVTNALSATTTGNAAQLVGTTFNIASAPSGALSGSALDDTITGKSNTLYQAFQAINTLNQELNGGNTTDVANLGTGATAVDTAITVLNGSADNGAVASLLNNFTNAISSTNSFVPDNLNNITEGYGKTSAASLVQSLMNALNTNSNISKYFQGTGATPLPASGDALTTLVSQVQSAISGVVGSTNAATITSGTLSAFATAAQQINAQIKALDTATGQTNISLATVAGLIDAYNLARAAIASGGVAGLKADQVSVIASTVSDAQAFNNVASAANQVAYITNNLGALVPSAGSPNMSDLGTKPMGIGGLIAQQLQADGLAPMSGQTISAYINTATPAQLQTAIQSVVNSSAYQNSPQLQAAIKALMVGQAIADTANYSDNSATVSSSDALKALIANANAVQALQKAGVNTATGSGAALSNGTLSKAQLEGLAGAIAGLQKTASTIIAYNSDTPAAQLAKAYEAAQTNNNNATSSLATLASGASKTSSASVSALQQAGKEYIQSLSGPTGVVAIQARSMASNSSWQFGTMINALSDGVTASSLNTSGIDSDIASNAAVLSGVANLQTAVSNLVATIYGPQGASQNTSFSVSQVQAQLGNLVNQIGALQEQVVQAMVALSNAATAANNPQAMVQNRALMGYLKQGFGGTTPPSASQRQANLVALQALMSKLSNLKSTALAAQLKYDGNGQVQKILAAENAPRRPVLSTQNGNMYGIDVQFGYKQFFGKKKRWGLRYYASFSYQHGTFNVSDADDVDNFVYGAGVDALYNFYESKDGNHTVGMFAGLMLAGSSWNVKGMSYYKNLMAQINAAGGKASMNTSYFQIPINIGFRTNVNRHNGFEIGLRIPLATNYFFDGTGPDGSALKIAYKRNISVFFNYVYNF